MDRGGGGGGMGGVGVLLNMLGLLWGGVMVLVVPARVPVHGCGSPDGELSA